MGASLIIIKSSQYFFVSRINHDMVCLDLTGKETDLLTD
jgi:hypothetical protein